MNYQPLASKMRPNKIDEIIGQDHLLGKGKPLRRLIETGTISSMILYGPPGCGKTTIAKVIKNEVDVYWEEISAVSSGVKELREIIERAKKEGSLFSKPTILFIDEIHRFNKGQQDAVLHAVEDGVVTLIGATTENPYYEINAPLLSRCQIYELKNLTEDEIRLILKKALESEKELTGKKMELDKESLTYIANESGGDARVALNLLEIIFRIVHKNKENNQVIKEIVREVIQKRGLYYNKKGDYHYDTISAFIKSLRGSEPDAGLYYLVRMLISGEDPKFIARRMIIFASEDIGNSNPEALIIATSAFNALEFVGMPEARICLAQAVIYLATSVKSNSTVKAVNKAWQDVENEYYSEIPAHLRNKPVNKGEKEYQYPHNFENHYVKQDYLPAGKETKYYFPTEQGNEMMIKKYLNSLKKNKKQK